MDDVSDGDTKKKDKKDKKDKKKKKDRGEGGEESAGSANGNEEELSDLDEEVTWKSRRVGK